MDLSPKDLKNALKDVLKSRKITLLNCAEYLEVSLSTAKRILGPEELPLTRLLQLLDWQGLSLSELEALAQKKLSTQEAKLSTSQEEMLAAYPGYLVFLLHLYEKTKVPDIQLKYDLSTKQVERILIKLERADLIRRHDSGDWNKVHARHRSLPSWNENGPLSSFFLEKIILNYSQFFVKKLKDNPELGKKDRGNEAKFQEIWISEREGYNFCRAVSDIMMKYQNISKVEKLSGRSGGYLTSMFLSYWHDSERVNTALGSFGGINDQTI